MVGCAATLAARPALHLVLLPLLLQQQALVQAKGVAGLGKAGGDGGGGSDKAGQQVPPEVYNALTYAGTAFLLTLSVPLLLYGLNKLLNWLEECCGCGSAARKQKQKQEAAGQRDSPPPQQPQPQPPLLPFGAPLGLQEKPQQDQHVVSTPRSPVLEAQRQWNHVGRNNVC